MDVFIYTPIHIGISINGAVSKQMINYGCVNRGILDSIHWIVYQRGVLWGQFCMLFYCAATLGLLEHSIQRRDGIGVIS
jgi:hypothetical protein